MRAKIINTGLVAALLLVLSGLSQQSVFAAIDCSNGSPTVAQRLVDTARPYNAEANPWMNLRHVFCGEINRRGRVVGFHSRPGGDNPTFQANPQAQPVVFARITNTVTTLIRTNASLDLFRYVGGTVQVYRPASGNYRNKAGNNGRSTFYPNDCSRAQVIKSIANAYYQKTRQGGLRSTKFRGPSAPAGPADPTYCYKGDGVTPFTIEMYIQPMGNNQRVTINTAYPLATP
ncbi:MAG: EndoU domain-containing protein [Gammaproteobacteria bacterium]|nr:EndoU domain-containing protein [Gammaproteobacteria bacterium]